MFDCANACNDDYDFDHAESGVVVVLFDILQAFENAELRDAHRQCVRLRRVDLHFIHQFQVDSFSRRTLL